MNSDFFLLWAFIERYGDIHLFSPAHYGQCDRVTGTLVRDEISQQLIECTDIAPVNGNDQITAAKQTSNACGCGPRFDAGLIRRSAGDNFSHVCAGVGAQAQFIHHFKAQRIH